MVNPLVDLLGDHLLSDFSHTTSQLCKTQVSEILNFLLLLVDQGICAIHVPNAEVIKVYILACFVSKSRIDWVNCSPPASTRSGLMAGFTIAV